MSSQMVVNNHYEEYNAACGMSNIKVHISGIDGVKDASL